MKRFEHDSRLAIQITSILECVAQTAISNLCTITNYNRQLTRTRCVCTVLILLELDNLDFEQKFKWKDQKSQNWHNHTMPKTCGARTWRCGVTKFVVFSVVGLDHARNNKTTRLLNITLLYHLIFSLSLEIHTSPHDGLAAMLDPTLPAHSEGLSVWRLDNLWRIFVIMGSLNDVAHDDGLGIMKGKGWMMWTKGASAIMMIWRSRRSWYELHPRTASAWWSTSVVKSSSVSCIFRHSAAHRGPQVPGKR